MKGTVLDLLGILLIIFIFSISTILATILMGTFTQTVTESGEIQGEALAILQNTNSFMTGFDAISVFVIFGLILAVILGAFMIDTHPAFFIVTVFLLLIYMIIVPQISNVFLAFAENPEIVSTANNFPYMIYMWQHMPLIILIAVVVISIVIYGKVRGGGQGGY
jgi:hypothetical protein